MLASGFFACSWANPAVVTNRRPRAVMKATRALGIKIFIGAPPDFVGDPKRHGSPGRMVSVRDTAAILRLSATRGQAAYCSENPGILRLLPTGSVPAAPQGGPASRPDRFRSRLQPGEPILTLSRGSFPALGREVVAMVPSVRGSLFQFVLEHIQQLLDTGRLTRKQLEAELTLEDLDILSARIGPATWVPIDTYRRTFDLLVSVEAPGNSEAYLFERGWSAAERLHKAGLYSQFEASTEKWGMRVGRLIVTLGPVMYNFTNWAFELDPG